jgi:Holliday junction resolvasome RuvABC endonuclease subunit
MSTTRTNIRYVMTVDPSLVCSGWALFDYLSGELVGVGQIRSSPNQRIFSERIAYIQERIVKVLISCQLGNKDILVCEGPTSMKDPAAAIKVEQVRGIFETIARQNQVTVPGRVNPRSVQSSVLGMRGCQLKRQLVKESAVVMVMQCYARPLERLGFEVTKVALKKYQDIVDAILVGAYVMSQLKIVRNLTTDELSGMLDSGKRYK